MAVTAKIYPLGIIAAYDGDIQAKVHIMKCGLLASSYTPSQTGHQIWLNVSSHEIEGEGYAAGGVTLSDVTLTLKAATTTFRFSASDCSWSGSTITARYAIIYDSTSGYLCSYVDFGEDKASLGSLFKIDFPDTDGIFQITT